MRFGVLGPLVVEDAKGPVDVKGPRHRAVLARLLIADGQVVPVDRLVDDLWMQPPAGALGAVQTFVGALRRALEPDRPPRSPARLLVTAPPGYALRAAPDDVDARRFERAVTDAAVLPPAAALPALDAALALWRGPAYAEFEDQAWTRDEIHRLNELHVLGAERRAETLLALGRAAEVVPDLETRVGADPWRENGWRLLALALYRTGRQSDALGALRRARQTLADEFGIDPGPELRRLEADILAQAEHLLPTVRPTPPQAAAPGLVDHGFVGRAEEFGQLTDAADTTVALGRLRLVLISGEAGAGKTTLAEAFATGLAAQGWTTATGTNPDDEGLPAAWPWNQILDRLSVQRPAPSIESVATGDAMAARFQWHRAVGSYLADVARSAPLLLILDDLHWAGVETLALLASVVAEQIAEPVLIVVAYRTTDVPAALADFLGRAARAEPTRIYLGGLSRSAVSDLVQGTIGTQIDQATADVIHQRSGGNPFFVRELARLLAADGPATLHAVPPGVRDVVRRRVAGLPEPVQATLRQAAVVGSDLDLDLLAALTGDGAATLDAVETAAASGFLVERGPGRFRFAHALVRDTLYQDLSRSRRASWHATIGARIELLRPDDVSALSALAHHYLAAEDPKGVRYARAAAEQAERRVDPHEAARLWQAALDHSHHSDGSSDSNREQLELIMGLVRALAVTGALDQARRHRATALDLAEKLADPTLTAHVLSAFDVPALWTDNDDPELAARVVDLAEQTLTALSVPGAPGTLTADEAATRSRLLATLALELRNTGGSRAGAAAREAEALARGLDDPALLAFALNARYMQSFEQAGRAPVRIGIGTELVDLAARHQLVTFEILGHLILVQAYSALAEFPVADRHAEAADRLGSRYQIPLVSVFTQWYRALRTALTGDATLAYRAAAAALTGTGMSGLDGILGLALLCDRLNRGEAPTDQDFGSYEPWCRPLVQLAAGRPVDLPAIPESPPDLLYEVRTSLHALVAVRLGDRATMEQLYERLLPAAGELAGAGSGLLTLRPVAHYLGDLATGLGRPGIASGHYEQARALRRKTTEGTGE